MSEVADPQLVSEVARGIVAEVAPDELPMFGVASEAYIADPKRASEKADPDEMLGFGGGAELALLTPVVLTVASGVVSYLVNAVLEVAKSEGEVVIQQRVRQLFKRFSGTETKATGAATTSASESAKPPGLTREQLVEVRRVAFEIASRTGITSAQAALVADSTVGQLVIAG
jgi:hypothetical protein